MERVATATAAAVPCDVLDLALADAGRRRIEWASLAMPVLRTVRKHFIKAQPFAGIRIAASLHVTAETANLMITLRDGGALPALMASSPLSVQDDIAAALVRDFHIPVYAVRTEASEPPSAWSEAVLSRKPSLIFDSGASLSSALAQSDAETRQAVAGAVEETSTGAARSWQLARQGRLAFPVIAACDGRVRSMFDNRHGAGQSTLDAIIRSTNLLLAGQTVVVAGYGACGRGIAARARGLGANVIITESDPVPAVEALMEGYRVLTMAEAAPQGDIFITVTGNRNVIGREIFDRLKDGAMLCNAGHSAAEIDMAALGALAASRRTAREFVEEFKMRDGRRVCVLAEGRVASLVAADGHPASAMDVSFATEALAAEYLLLNRETLGAGVHSVPESIDRQVARMKLDSLGLSIDKLSIEQEQYLDSVRNRWSEES